VRKRTGAVLAGTVALSLALSACGGGGDNGTTTNPSQKGASGFNAGEDRRHDRRTISVVELQKVISAAQPGPPYRLMPGPPRALCYRLAVSTGLRYSEISSLTPRSLGVSSVTVNAAYAKNGRTATIPLARDVASDLAGFAAGLEPGDPIFPLPPGEGAEMLRVDLEAALVPYRDDAGRVFDFHALRCQCATLADAAGASPRVVQRLMRHSSLDMTNRYTRPRMHDLEGAVDSLPSLRPEIPDREAGAANGTHGRPISESFAHQLPTAGDGTGRFLAVAGGTDGPTPGLSPGPNTDDSGDLGVSVRFLTDADGNDRGGARTHDQRINVPHRLSPTPRDVAGAVRVSRQPPQVSIPGS